MGVEKAVVTVVVPIYNVSQFLDKCISSIIDQTYENIEVILVNDGSTDDSGHIIDSYVAKDRRVLSIHQDNAGVSSARNAGIEAATGEYICFVDGDDWVEKDYVEYLMGLMLQDDVDISLSTQLFSLMHPKQTLHDTYEIYSPEQATAEILYSNIPIGCYSKLFRKEFLDANKLRFLPEYRMGEGFNFNTSAFQQANAIAVGRKKIYNYRLDNADSVTTRFNINRWQNGLDALDNIRNNLTINTAKVKTAWRFAWWLTNYDVMRLMIGASAQKTYRKQYLACYKVVRNETPRLATVSGSLGRKARIIMIKSNPVLASKIDNGRRSRIISKNCKPDGAIVCITANNNYGNVIQRWALQEFLRKNGHNFVSYYFYGYYWRQYIPRQSPLFAVPRKVIYSLLGKREHLRRSSGIYNYRNLSRFCNNRIRQELFTPFLQKKYGTYIVGSDQVFNYSVISNEFLVSWKNFFLKFVKWDAKRIAYAPSFGNETLKKSDSPIKRNEIKKLMHKFNAVSARESSGVVIMRDTWGINAAEVLDPTLLLAKEDYGQLISNPVSALHEVSQVFYYILRDDARSTLLSFAEALASMLGKRVGGILGYNTQELPPVEQWLKGFADAEFVVTDSFHGTVFSLLNHKDFIVICSTKFKNGGGSVRYRNLLDKVGLGNRVIDECDFADFRPSRLEPIDWVDVDSRIEKLRHNSASWLLHEVNK